MSIRGTYWLERLVKYTASSSALWVRWAAEPTHKVLSLGMWLKLDTGMLLMLLLFSVLRDMEEKKMRERRNQEEELLHTYRTSSVRRALKAPSSMQLMWFLSS